MEKEFDIKGVLRRIIHEVDQVIEKKRTSKNSIKYGKEVFLTDVSINGSLPMSRDTYYKYKAYANTKRSKKQKKNTSIQSINLSKFFDICVYTDVSADYYLGFNKTKRKEASAERISKEFGLSDESMETLAKIKEREDSRGKDNLSLGQLSTEIINMILGNKKFWSNFDDRLQVYLSCQFDGRVDDADIDTARYNLVRTFEVLIDEICYELIKQKTNTNTNTAELDSSSPTPTSIVK